MRQTLTASFLQELSSDNGITMLRAGADQLTDDLPGVNALFIDREGTGLSTEATNEAVASARKRDLFPIIRSDGTGDVELALCATAKPDAIVLPQLRDADELTIARNRLADTSADTLTEGHNIALIAQIETVEAVENAEELMNVPGIAGFLIGPNDLAEDMGYPGKPDHPLVEEAVTLVAAKLASANRAFGLPAMTHAARTAWQQRGARLLFITLDAYRTLEVPS